MDAYWTRTYGIEMTCSFLQTTSSKIEINCNDILKIRFHKICASPGRLIDILTRASRDTNKYHPSYDYTHNSLVLELHTLQSDVDHKMSLNRPPLCSYSDLLSLTHNPRYKRQSLSAVNSFQTQLWSKPITSPDSTQPNDGFQVCHHHRHPGSGYSSCLYVASAFQSKPAGAVEQVAVIGRIPIWGCVH